MFRAAVAFRAALSGLCLKGEGIVLMRLVRIVCCALLVFPLGEHCFGQSRPCFAFLLGGDVTVACDGRATKITNLGNVESFAITEEQSSLGYTTSRLTGRSESTTVYAYTATVVDLNTGKSRMIDGVRGVVNTCGGLFSIHHVGDLLSSTRELVSGAELEFRLYDWFRCSSDRKTVVGSTRETGADLLEGLRTGAKIAAAGDFSVMTLTSVQVGRRSLTSTNWVLSVFFPLPVLWLNVPQQVGRCLTTRPLTIRVAFSSPLAHHGSAFTEPQPIFQPRPFPVRRT